MHINLRAFGQLTDIVKIKEVILTGNADTDNLVHELKKLYPALANKIFMIAIDKKTISCNTILNDDCTVALMPPFSGG